MGIQAKATQAVSQLMSLNMLMWLTMLTFFAGILFLAAAVYMAWALILPPAIAALLAGIALLIVCALLALPIYVATQRSAGTTGGQTAEPRADNTTEPRSEPVVSDPAAEWASRNTGIVTACALAAGIAFAASPGLRRFALRTAGPIITRKLIHALEDVTDR